MSQLDRAPPFIGRPVACAGGSAFSAPAAVTAGVGHYAVSPGIPGDSGSAFLDAQGRAIGVLSTLGLLPLPASNNASDVNRSVAYARTHGQAGLVLENGTEAFNPGQLPLGI